MDGTRAERYEPTHETRIGIDLAQVKTPDDALAFRRAIWPVRSSARRARRGGMPGAAAPAVRGFSSGRPKTSADLPRIVSDVKQAVRGDEAALNRMRQEFRRDANANARLQTASGVVTVKESDLHPAEYFVNDDRTILIRASDWASLLLNNGLGDARPYRHTTRRNYSLPLLLIPAICASV